MSAAARFLAGRRASAPRGPEARAQLRSLERLRAEFGGDAAARKLALLASLDRASLDSARDVERLHEALCFLQVYPDDVLLLARVNRMLARFAHRQDLRRHARTLESSGIAGTEIRFRFFEPTARWLADRWPRQLRFDWREFENEERLEHWLPHLAHAAEAPGLDEYAFTPRQWVQRMKGAGESDAVFLIRRFAALPMSAATRETLYDELDPPLVLAPGHGTPSRTLARVPGSRPVYQTGPLDSRRPELRRALREHPRSVRRLGPAAGQRWIDVTRSAMVTRERDLDAFSYADPRDVRVVEWGDGLQFVVMGVIPERRLMLETVVAFLTVRNGVPIGYVLVSALFGSSEIAYNVFETWRGGESGKIYGRVLATTRALFGSDAFTIFPYQLGDGNQEGLRSGAWWFYRKLGFEPLERHAIALAKREQARIARDRRYRTPLATLQRLAQSNLYYFSARRRKDVIGMLDLPNVGLRITRMLAREFGSDRERAGRECSERARKLLGLRSPSGWTRDERAAWERWAPLVCVLPSLERWPAADHRALAAVIRAKGGRSEADFTLAFDRHRRLRAAIEQLATS